MAAPRRRGNPELLPLPAQAEVDAACKAHDADRMRAAKKRRKDHYVMVRAEKLNYYQHRWQSRSTTTVKISLILDKMDSSKNHIIEKPLH